MMKVNEHSLFILFLQLKISGLRQCLTGILVYIDTNLSFFLGEFIIIYHKVPIGLLFLILSKLL